MLKLVKVSLVALFILCTQVAPAAACDLKSVAVIVRSEQLYYTVQHQSSVFATPWRLARAIHADLEEDPSAGAYIFHLADGRVLRTVMDVAGATMDGNQVVSTLAPVREAGRDWVPVRLLAEAAGYHVAWTPEAVVIYQ